MKKIIPSQAEVQRIIQLYSTDKMGLQAMEKLLNISQVALKRILVENGVEINLVGRRLNGGKVVANKRYRDQHKDQCSLLRKEWVKNNKTKVDAMQKRWRERNKLVKLAQLTNLTFDKIKDLISVKKIINTPLRHQDIVLTKDYLIEYKKNFKKEQMKSFVPDLVTFFRKYHPEFPYPVLEEDLLNVRSQIKNYDFSTVYHDEKSFKNTTSPVGNNYLKHLFKEYWACSYQNNLSPVECWRNDKELGRIIAWRIGINNSNETYNLSPKIIIRGMSAARQTISFFKPLVAAAIYKHYNVDNKQNLVVFDPCAGFGGRMLGFKSLYPDGKYIALEPNKYTFSNLETLAGELGDCELHKTTLEDFNKNIEYDFVFTSIPYFDMESYYGEETSYKDFEEWKNIFIKKLLTYPRLIVNMSAELCNKLKLNQYIDTYLMNQPSHFTKIREPKKEVIIKMNF